MGRINDRGIGSRVTRWLDGCQRCVRRRGECTPRIVVGSSPALTRLESGALGKGGGGLD